MTAGAEAHAGVDVVTATDTVAVGATPGIRKSEALFGPDPATSESALAEGVMVVVPANAAFELTVTRTATVVELKTNAGELSVSSSVHREGAARSAAATTVTRVEPTPLADVRTMIAEPDP